jgi:hypothetical protein
VTEEGKCYECGEVFKKGDAYYTISEGRSGKIVLCELCAEELEDAS